MKLIKNGEVYTPEYIGKKDILMINNKIIRIAENIPTDMGGIELEVIDATDKYVVPGFIDQHVHIVGGGGEAGFESKIPESQLTHYTTAGTTTTLGLLGTDATTRSLESLLAKARALETEGITTFILTGSYEFPSHTLTGSIRRDIILIDKVIGAKIAVADHRASYVTPLELMRVASDARVAGMISGKPGIVTVHVGDGEEHLNIIMEAVHKSYIPMKHFIPTHINRKKSLYNQALNYAKMGGYIDFTADTSPVTGDSDSVKVSTGIKNAIEEGVNIENMTISSDGNGSCSEYDEKGNLIKIGISPLDTLHLELKDLVFDEGFELATALKLITSNVAKVLQIYPRKGTLREQCDADVVLLDKKLDIDSVFAKGQTMILYKEIKKRGLFEKE